MTQESKHGSPARENDEERAMDVASRLEGEEYRSREELEEDLNGDSDVSDLAFVKLHNLNALEKYRDAEGDAALFLPHCLRDSEDCVAERTREGYDCKGCMECEIGSIQEHVGDLIDVYMVPGGGMIRKILRDRDYDAVVGVACFPELELGKKMTGSQGVPTQMVPLDEDGCQDTSVDIEKVLDRVLTE